MYSRFHVVMIASMLLLAVFIVVAFFTLQRQTAFEEREESSGRTTLAAAANQINALIANRQERVHIFTEEHQGEIEHLALHPGDEAALDAFRGQLERRFANLLAFTVADSDGQAMIEDVESLVGQQCSKDLQHYSQLVVSRGAAYRNPPWIHPQPGNYHFDVMAHWRASNGSIHSGGVFFVSFRPSVLAEVLDQHARPRHQLLLVKEEDRRLIEVTADGARDQLDRAPRLSTAELSRVELSRAVPGTAWRLLLLPDAELHADYQRRIWLEAAAVMGAALALTILLLWLSARHQRLGGAES